MPRKDRSDPRAPQAPDPEPEVPRKGPGPKRLVLTMDVALGMGTRTRGTPIGVVAGDANLAALAAEDLEAAPGWAPCEIETILNNRHLYRVG